MNSKQEEAFGNGNPAPAPENNPPLYANPQLPPRNINTPLMPSAGPYTVFSQTQPVYQAVSHQVDQKASYTFQGPTMSKIKGIPVNIICPNCHQNVVTVIKRKNGGKMALAVIGTAIVCWPLAWIPLLVKPLKDKKHACPSCGTDLGKTIYLQSQTI
ncbi:hypothetical protein BB559_003257 [Furculomyces boomerangus]|uniref:LITAF domain-containing protein n=2 Tax=Harpellales TaxID=61421 RepID=A0A2T9YMC8_9FUNG|nr:hypothetical protein BB559_003257 [Furculomyces boomerangus]PVZ96946.1 hypothetical protein BB558_007118 [Smittium angustum]PVZ99765.1 hypothetical protein BB558_004180 [Smittium angustum]